MQSGEGDFEIITIHHRNNFQSNVALSSGAAELTAAARAVSETIAVIETTYEIQETDLTAKLMPDANACQGMLPTASAGNVKHLCTKQVWVQGSVQTYHVEVKNVPRAEKNADTSTHPLPGHLLTKGLRDTKFYRIINS